MEQSDLVAVINDSAAGAASDEECLVQSDGSVEINDPAAGAASDTVQGLELLLQPVLRYHSLRGPPASLRQAAQGL